MSRRILLTAPVGGSSGAVTLPASLSVDATIESPSTAEASITFDEDGLYETSLNPGLNIPWFTPDFAGVGADYQIRFAVSSGSVSSGTIDTWLSFPQTWTRSRTGVGFVEVSGTLEIRLTASGVVQDSCPMSLSAEVI